MKPYVNIQLTGTLAEKFGERHRYRADSLREAGAALRVCVPGFAEHVLSQGEQGILYRAVNVKRSGYEQAIAPDEINRPLGSTAVLVISPVTAGSGGNALKFLTGAVLIGIGAATGFAPLIYAGGAQILQGVASLLSPAPKTPDTQAEREQSYLFSGLRAGVDEGAAIPLIYGRVFVPLVHQLSLDSTTAEFRQ